MTIHSHPTLMKVTIALSGWLVAVVAELQGLFSSVELRTELWLNSLRLNNGVTLVDFPMEVSFACAFLLMLGVSFVSASLASFFEKGGLVVLSLVVIFFGVFVSAIWGLLLTPFSWLLGGCCSLAFSLMMKHWRHEHPENSGENILEEDNEIHLSRIDSISLQEMEVPKKES